MGILLAIFTYLIFVFINVDWNVTNWNMLSRVIVVVLYLFALIMFSMSILGEEDK